MRFVDQAASIGGAINATCCRHGEGSALVAEYGPPGGARVRRLDQGVGEIAQLRIVGELELRGLQPEASRHLAADPAMHVSSRKLAVRRVAALPPSAQL